MMLIILTGSNNTMQVIKQMIIVMVVNIHLTILMVAVIL